MHFGQSNSFFLLPQFQFRFLYSKYLSDCTRPRFGDSGDCRSGTCEIISESGNAFSCLPFGPILGKMWVVGVRPMVRVITVFIRPRRALEMGVIIGPIGTIGPVWPVHVG